MAGTYAPDSGIRVLTPFGDRDKSKDSASKQRDLIHCMVPQVERAGFTPGKDPYSEGKLVSAVKLG